MDKLPWLGASVKRKEDDRLLRGSGRFLQAAGEEFDLRGLLLGERRGGQFALHRRALGAFGLPQRVRRPQRGAGFVFTIAFVIRGHDGLLK